MSGFAQASLIEDNFDSVIISNGLHISGSPSLNNLNLWIDFPNSNRWGIQNGGAECQAPCSGEWARHLIQESDNTNLLFYGAPGPFSSGDMFDISFDYIAQNRAGTLFFFGLNAGDDLDPYAPWGSADPDGDDGDELLKETLVKSAEWTSFSKSIKLTQNYDALAIGFAMGGTDGIRGVDNVQVKQVPEPASLALFGLGALGLAFRRFKSSSTSVS